jgi:hypothetical protein
MANTIRNYRNIVNLNFEKRGDSFTLNVPHKNKWLAIIRFLKRRGFKVTENAYYKKQYECLSPYHKIGYKKDIVMLMEINCGRIDVEFGNIQNLWKDKPQNFWNDPSDDRHTKLTYLEGLAVKLEIKKLMQFCDKYNHEFVPEDSSFNPEEYIINKLNINSHIHGKVTCLNDIKKSIAEDSYDYTHNSTDANGKKIICGENKYFYDYFTRRLSVGVAWHNINNMWWVIVNNRKYNIACFNLFDFDPAIPKRKPASKGRMNRILRSYEKKQDYLRCHDVKRAIDRIAV